MDSDIIRIAMEKRHCSRCGGEYAPIGRTQKYCLNCKRQLKNASQNKRNQLIRDLRSRDLELLPYCPYCKTRSAHDSIPRGDSIVKRVCRSCGAEELFIEGNMDRT